MSACCKKKGALSVVPMRKESNFSGESGQETIMVCSGKAYIPVSGYMSCKWSSVRADCDKTTTLQCASDMIKPILRAIPSIAPAIVLPDEE